MITITMNDDFTLTQDGNIIPAQWSGNIPFKFEPGEAYKDYIIVPGYIYWDGSKTEQAPISNYVAGVFTVPARPFRKDGMLGIAFTLTKAGAETITTTVAEFEVRESINLGIDIPKEDVWQQMLINFVDQYMEKVHDKVLKDLQEQAQELQSHAVDLQNHAIDLQSVANKAIEDLNTLITEVNGMVDNGDFTPEFTIGTVKNSDEADVTLTGTKRDPVLNLTLPKGDPNILAIGSVEKGDEASATITGDSPNQVLSLTLPKGDPNILTIGAVEKGEEASATIIGDSPNQILNLTLPKGDKGEKGDKGDKGEQGEIGPAGIQGPKGDGILVSHIVAELPEVGGNSDIYFVVDGENYISYMYVEDKWITIGSGASDVDLSNYYTKEETNEISQHELTIYYAGQNNDVVFIQLLSAAYRDLIKNMERYKYFKKSCGISIPQNTDVSIYQMLGLPIGEYTVTMYGATTPRASVMILFYSRDDNAIYYIRTLYDDNLLMLTPLDGNTVIKITDEKDLNSFVKINSQTQTLMNALNLGTNVITAGTNDLEILQAATNSFALGNIDLQMVLQSKKVPQVMLKGGTKTNLVTENDITAMVKSEVINNIVKLSLSDYSSIPIKDPDTLYFIGE